MSDIEPELQAHTEDCPRRHDRYAFCNHPQKCHDLRNAPREPQLQDSTRPPWAMPCESGIVVSGCECDPCWSRRKLEALAREMAEAILALTDDWDKRLRQLGYNPDERGRYGPWDPVEAAIDALAVKLRAIGGAS